MSHSEKLSRRTLLSAAIGAVSALAVTDAASAGSIPPKAVSYQMTPNDGKQCSGCKLFIAGDKPDAPGACKSVSGEINPNGWCKLWAAKDA